MAPLTRRIVLSKEVFERIKNLKKGVGFIYGFACEDTFEVLGLALCKTETIADKLAVDGARVNIESDLSECLSYVQSSLPAGVGIIGHVLVNADDFLLNDALESAYSLFLSEKVYNTDTPLFVIYSPSEDKLVVNVMEESQEQVETDYELAPMSEILQPYILIRLRAQLTLSSEFNNEAIEEEFAEQLKKVASGAYTFHFKQSGAYLKSNEEDGICGIQIEKHVEHLAGKGDDGKKKKKAVSTEMEVLTASLLLKPIKFITPGEQDPITNCAPVIQHRKKEYDEVSFPLIIDGLSLVPRDSALPPLYDTLVDCVRRQLVAAEACVLSELSSTKKISPPQAMHFSTDLCPHFITLFYPKKVPDSELVTLREKRHEIFALPKDRPFFRRGCKHVFRDDVSANVPLTNPHVGLSPPVGLKNAEVGIVSGRYSYHHYMQDGIDDNGWGCAYRSLQTLVSWFRWQGYTEALIPTHRAIQQCLVDIGDKPSSFVGSRQWIGSTEVGFCLETLLGVTSRIMAVSSGEELCNRGDELLRHFNTQGTPVMIGGGVLAHTILGVALERETGSLRFLVLDPHYTSAEDLGAIQAKGWCGWKGPDFWMKTAFYNLCMPQRPKTL